eukprot:Lithocolla_globosa_v1_NODE_152_length_5671_cov_121.982906.p2 type:complete len:256 gc:universal NODE_152_length_5671_cov_121.982906:3944-4711(+)
MIDFLHFVIDPLHCFLRVSDVLFKCLVEDVMEFEDITPGLRLLETQVKKCGVGSFEFFKDNKEALEEGTGKVRWRSMMGPDKHKIITNLDIVAALPSHPKRAREIKRLWEEFDCLWNAVDCWDLSITNLTPAEFKIRAKQWVKDLTVEAVGIPNRKGYKPGMYGTDIVTPYMHAFVFHVPEFLTAWGGLKRFSTEAAELKNHVQVSYFFRGSRKGGMGSSATQELMEREGRLLYYLKNKDRIDAQAKTRSIVIKA